MIIDNHKNIAFISYSSKDEEIAKRLQKELEEFILPIGIVKITNSEKDRLGKIFRDRTDLQAGCSLTESLKRELDNTEWLIVICSDNVRSSTWVDEEIKYFSNLPNRIDKIIPFISYLTSLNKDIIDCFPNELIHIHERKSGILAADSRHGKDGWERSIAKTIASLLKINLDDWLQRLFYDVEIKKYSQLISDIKIEIAGDNLPEAQNKLIRYVNEKKIFNLVNLELKFLFKKCNIDIGSFYVKDKISAIDYNNNVIVVGTINGDIFLLDILYGTTKISFNAHSEAVESINIIDNNLVLTRISNIDNIIIKLWKIYDKEKLVWEISHPIAFPENISNNDSFKIFKNFLIPFRESNIEITPDRKYIAFSIGGYVVIADIETSKIIYYIEMPQPAQIMPHVNFINEIKFNSKLNYGIAKSLNETIYWNLLTRDIENELTDDKKKYIENKNIENKKSNLFKLTTSSNKITIFDYEQIQTVNENIKYYIHNINSKKCNFLISEDHLILKNDYTKNIYKIGKNTCPFLFNFNATISECGNYLGILKPSNLSEPGNIDIYSSIDGELLLNFKIKNIHTNNLFKMLTIYVVGSYITSNLEVISYTSDNNIRVYCKNKDVLIYKVDINKKPSKVIFCNKDIISVIYTDNSLYVWKYIDNQWINTDRYIEENILCAKFISEYILALGNIDGYLILWKLDDHLVVKSSRIHFEKINCLSLTSDSTRIVLGCNKYIKIAVFNIFLEKIINTLDIEISINPNDIYLDNNKIIAIENNKALEVIHIENIYSCEEEIVNEKFYRRKNIIEGDRNEMA